jgi:hypothetical protein
MGAFVTPDTPMFRHDSHENARTSTKFEGWKLSAGEERGFITWRRPRLRDVKNEGTSGDVYENTGRDDKMSCEKHRYFTKNARIAW